MGNISRAGRSLRYYPCGANSVPRIISQKTLRAVATRIARDRYRGYGNVKRTTRWQTWKDHKGFRRLLQNQRAVFLEFLRLLPGRIFAYNARCSCQSPRVVEYQKRRYCPECGLVHPAECYEGHVCVPYRAPIDDELLADVRKTVDRR